MNSLPRGKKVNKTWKKKEKKRLYKRNFVLSLFLSLSVFSELYRPSILSSKNKFNGR